MMKPEKIMAELAIVFCFLAAIPGCLEHEKVRVRDWEEIKSYRVTIKQFHSNLSQGGVQKEITIEEYYRSPGYFAAIIPEESWKVIIRGARGYIIKGGRVTDTFNAGERGGLFLSALRYAVENGSIAGVTIYNGRECYVVNVSLNHSHNHKSAKIYIEKTTGLPVAIFSEGMEAEFIDAAVNIGIPDYIFSVPQPENQSRQEKSLSACRTCTGR